MVIAVDYNGRWDTAEDRETEMEERNGNTDLEKWRAAEKEMKETEIQWSGRGLDSEGEREEEPERQMQ